MKNDMEKLMKVPKYIDLNNSRYTVSYFNGDRVKYLFYNQGIWRENHIPQELEKKGWIPEDNKTYKCWWYWTNPADPADSGEDILVYIEEFEDRKVLEEKTNLKQEINNIIDSLDLDNLKTTKELLKYKFG